MYCIIVTTESVVLVLKDEPYDIVLPILGKSVHTFEISRYIILVMIYRWSWYFSNQSTDVSYMITSVLYAFNNQYTAHAIHISVAWFDMGLKEYNHFFSRSDATVLDDIIFLLKLTRVHRDPQNVENKTTSICIISAASAHTSKNVMLRFGCSIPTWTVNKKQCA